MDQRPMFLGAVEAAIISAKFHLGKGWTLRLQLRRQYEHWDDCRTEVYERLTTDELVDTLDGALGTFRGALGYGPTGEGAGAGWLEAD